MNSANCALATAVASIRNDDTSTSCTGPSPSSGYAHGSSLPIRKTPAGTRIMSSNDDVGARSEMRTAPEDGLGREGPQQALIGPMLLAAPSRSVTSIG